MISTLDRGASLVADDRVVIWTPGGDLYGRAPDTRHGLIEARGLDVLPHPTVGFAQIGISVHCESPDREIERIHLGETETIGGVEVPLLHVRAFEASAPAKLFAALRRLGREAAKAQL